MEIPCSSSLCGVELLCSSRLSCFSANSDRLSQGMDGSTLLVTVDICGFSANFSRKVMGGNTLFFVAQYSFGQLQQEGNEREYLVCCTILSNEGVVCVQYYVENEQV
jgi:hypothetical protein